MTFATAGFVILAYLLSFRLARMFYGVDGFSEYALARRTLSLITPVAILGSDYATARFVAYSAAKDDPASRTYFPAALVVMSFGVATVSALLLLLPSFFSDLLFGSARYVALVLAIPWTIAGLGLYSITYNNLRGELRFKLANTLMVANFGVVPLVALWVAPSLPLALVGFGIGWAVTSALFVPLLRVRYTLSIGRIREVVRYGLPRVPGDVLLMALYALPSLLAVHLADLTTAGLVALGTAGLGAVTGLLSPISFILLPMSARYLADGQVLRLRAEVTRIVAIVLAAILPGVVATQVFLGPAIFLYLGSDFRNLEPLRILVLAAIPMSLFTVLRSVVDAHHIRAVNTRNIAISTAVFTFCAAASQVVWPGMLAILVAFDASACLLAVLTVLETYRVLHLRDTAPQLLANESDPSELTGVQAAPAVPLGGQ